MHARTCTRATLIGETTLTAAKPKRGYPLALRSVGDHIKASRLDRNLTQKAVAAALGVSQFTIINWELNRHRVADRFMNEIVRWLGHSLSATKLG